MLPHRPRTTGPRRPRRPGAPPRPGAIGVRATTFAAVAATMSVAACLAAGVTISGTLAAWNASSAAPAGTVTSGGLAVDLDPAPAAADAPDRPIEPGVTIEHPYQLTARVSGDNAAATLDLTLPAWAEWTATAGVDVRDVLDVTFRIDALGVSGDLLDPAGPALRLAPDGSVGDGSLPVVQVPAEGITLPVVLTISMSPYAGNAYQNLGLPAAELTATLDQARP
jgi:predicted ribosomally synthesized peptide with SipW-like signal peptide